MKVLFVLVFFVVVLVQCSENNQTETYDQTCLMAMYKMFNEFSTETVMYMQNSGMNIGNMGNYYECITMEDSSFCAVQIGLPKVLGLDSVKNGMCVPSVCNSTTLRDAIVFLGKSEAFFSQVIAAWVNNETFTGFDESETNSSGFYLKSVACEDTRTMDTPAWVILIIIISLVVVNVLSSLFDCAYDGEGALREKFMGKLFLSFSGYSNIPRLVAPVPHSTKVLNGLRTFMMCYVILGHTNVFMISGAFDDYMYVLENVWPTMAFQFIRGGFFAVDAFFYLSGFLMAYLLLEEIQKSNKVNWPMLYLHRFLRLTPTYAFVIFFYMYLFPKMGSGPFYYTDVDNQPFADDKCKNYWWTNLLYINNIHPWELYQECLGWSWYLANDMQFFLITPPILMLYSRKKIAGIAVLIVMFLGSVVSVAALTIHFDFEVGLFDKNYSTLVYIKPWTRIAPYVVGVVFAIFARENPNITFPKIGRYIAYFVSTTLICLTVFGTYKDTEWTLFTKIFYWSLSRPAFATALGLITLTCLYGKGGIFKKILCANMFTITARLTFAAYLLHPMVQFFFYTSGAKSITWTPYIVTLYFIAFCVISYAAAFVLYCLVEKPIMNLEKLITEIFVPQNVKEHEEHISEDGLLFNMSISSNDFEL